MTHRAIDDLLERNKVSAKITKLRARQAAFVERQRKAGADV